MYHLRSWPSIVVALMTVHCLLLSSVTPSQAQAAERSLKYEMTVQRACEAAIWGMPAIGIYGIEASIPRDLDGKFGDVVYFSKPMTSRHGFLTANDVTPYVTSAQSTKDGPLVIEVPPAGEKASYFGTIVDSWDMPLADVGPPGEDKGKGGKYLFLPPGYDRDVPDGYFVYRPLTYGVHFAFRPVAKNGGTLEDQAAYARKLQVYKLSEAGNPPETTFLDAYPRKWNTLPQYDLSYFRDLHTVIQNEPVLERDKAMMGLLASIGIEKGKPFEPTPEDEMAMLEGLQRAYDWMQDTFINRSTEAWWKDRQWQVWKFAEGQPEAGFPYFDDNRILIDQRAGGAYFWITYLPKVLGGGTFYLTGLRDKDGDLMNGRDIYKLTVPADTPAKDFWSVIVYSMRTKGFVEGVDRVGLSSLELSKMKKNDDGSVNIYFAPQAPEGLDNNWVPTGEDFFLLFRLYGPDKPLFEKTWTLNDVEKVGR